MDAPRCVTLRCGHSNLCKSCFARLGPSPRCPSCRAPAVRTETARRGTRTCTRSARVVSTHSGSSTILSPSSSPRILEAEVDTSTLELYAPITGPAAGSPRLILLMGSRGVPLATLAKRLAAEEATADASSAANGMGSGEDSPPQWRRSRFAFLMNENGNDDSFSEAVTKIRAYSPHLIVLCAHPDYPSTFEHLVKMDIALCVKFGRSAPRSWVLVRPSLGNRRRNGACVDALDVQNALHYLGLGPAREGCSKVASGVSQLGLSEVFGLRGSIRPKLGTTTCSTPFSACDELLLGP
jgi:hypothetical protein